MRPQPNGRIVRVKKLNRSTGQQILREDQIDPTEYDSLQGHYKIETGVEKGEEGEYHLQAALASSSTGEKEGEIPAPPAEVSADIDYNSLYSLKFDKPATYIRFSQTVEECTACQYDMTTEDDVFLKEYNQKRPVGARCSEDDFEATMDVFEETAELQAPFSAVDNTVVSFEVMRHALKQQMDEKSLTHAKDIYEHWKIRRQASGNDSIQPSLKFETHQDNDDGDPYVCFRRREVRQTRKTRARDVQSTDKLKRLRKELEDGRRLVAMSHHRESLKNELLKNDLAIYKERSELKKLKIQMGIKADDEDLINQKPQKRKISDFPQLQQRQPGAHMRVLGRPDGRPLDTDLLLLSDFNAQKENMILADLLKKCEQHEMWNANFEDLTREPLSPVDQGPQTGFRLATAQYQLMTPPSSVTSETFDQPSPEKPEPFQFRHSSPPEEDEPPNQVAYRRRIGRLNRFWIDRRVKSPASKDPKSFVSDRWKYDQDDDDEQPVYELDPFDTEALLFRTRLTAPPTPPQRVRPESSQQGRPSGVSPPNRSIAGTPQAQAPTTTA